MSWRQAAGNSGATGGASTGSQAAMAAGMQAGQGASAAANAAGQQAAQSGMSGMTAAIRPPVAETPIIQSPGSGYDPLKILERMAMFKGGR